MRSGFNEDFKYYGVMPERQGKFVTAFKKSGPSRFLLAVMVAGFAAAGVFLIGTSLAEYPLTYLAAECASRLPFVSGCAHIVNLGDTVVMSLISLITAFSLLRFLMSQSLIVLALAFVLVGAVILVGLVILKVLNDIFPHEPVQGT